MKQGPHSAWWIKGRNHVPRGLRTCLRVKAKLRTNNFIPNKTIVQQYKRRKKITYTEIMQDFEETQMYFS